MIRVILDGSKTQTRRVMRPQPEDRGIAGWHYPLDKKPYRGAPVGVLAAVDSARCPYGQPGDRLWVRETWAEDGWGYTYRATNETWPHHWAPSIFMPRKAARILLTIRDIRVERVRDITEEDARAEGVAPDGRAGVDPHKYAFKRLWEVINGKRPGCSWAHNPWCWVIGFEQT